MLANDADQRPLLDVRRTNTILYCRHWLQAVGFYRDVLGLTVHHATDWLVEFKVTDSGFVSIADASRTTIACAAGNGITLSWQVDDVVALHGKMAAVGVPVGPIQSKWGARVFYFHDPEGHRLEAWST
ncbi:MAG: VOC family protein [Desulfatitalea sp.]|nr:VOC family protein [Desulfatitalea sp.]